MEILEEKKESRWTTILLIIMNIILWGIIGLIAFFWNGVVHALTPVEANFNYTQNGQNISYNIKPDGGTTGFIYENEFFGQTISHSAYKHYLPATGNIGEITTTNINGYFVNPCSSGQDISYTMKINFYKQSTDQNTMAWVRVTNGIDGCTGYFEVINGVYTYNNVCNLKSGDVPKFSLYFQEDSRGQTFYRVGIPTNFSYTCQVGNQAIIDADNANTNKIINKLDSISGGWISEMEATYESVNPDGADFEDLEDVETSLHTYTNVNLNSFDVDLDSDTNSWVWNTLTSILNTHTLIFGMIISILSIGLIKLILNR